MEWAAAALLKLVVSKPPGPVMQYRVAYEHSLKGNADDFIVSVPCQVVDDIPANIPRALLPEYLTELLLGRSPLIAKVRNLRILA
ncbi:hypothetical protein [Burkholderia contaminans]|uniref:hypothetical protein n=2 Tax=Burkholderia contaminans TaxID=488447 RepID=UPI00299EA218|nr:hypothetical protein [Burkholderia contaminans]